MLVNCPSAWGNSTGKCILGTCEVVLSENRTLCECKNGWVSNKAFNTDDYACALHSYTEIALDTLLCLLSGVGLILLVVIVKFKMRESKTFTSMEVVIRSVPSIVALGGLTVFSIERLRGRVLTYDFVVSAALGVGALGTYISCLVVYQKLINFLLMTQAYAKNPSRHLRRLALFSSFKRGYIALAAVSSALFPLSVLVAEEKKELVTKLLLITQGLSSLGVIGFVKLLYDPVLQEMEAVLKLLNVTHKHESMYYRTMSMYKSSKRVRKVHLFMNGFNLVLDSSALFIPVVFLFSSTLVTIRALSGVTTFAATIFQFVRRMGVPNSHSEISGLAEQRRKQWRHAKESNGKTSLSSEALGSDAPSTVVPDSDVMPSTRGYTLTTIPTFLWSSQRKKLHVVPE